jgi:MFS family permease
VGQPGIGGPGYRLLVAAFTVPTLLAGPVLGAYLDRLRRRRPLFTLSQALLAVVPSLWAGLPAAAAAGIADGPALAATLTVRQGTVPPDRYAQVLSTASSFKVAAYSAGSAAAGLLAGVRGVRELVLALAAGQLLSAAPLLRS